MEKLLYIDSCIRREESRSRQAADYLMKKMEASGKYEIETLCLMDEPLHYLSGDFFRQRERLLAEGRRDHRRFDYAHQFARADVIVIAAPFWDLGFPALLKTYIENISVDGITFYADIEGCHGMSQGRQLIFVTTRGGYYENTPLEMGSLYMEALSVFFGIDQYRCFFAEGLDIEGNDQKKLMQNLFDQIDEFAADWT